MIIRDSEYIDLATPYGPMRTFIYRPEVEGRYPGIIFFTDIFLVTEPIRRIAALLAGNGFIVAIPEIFHELESPGTVLPYIGNDGRTRGNSHKVTKLLDSFDSDARAAIECLAAHQNCNGKLGALGLSIGGHLALRAAMNREILAAVCFYATDIHNRNLGNGQSANTLDRLGEIKGDLVMIWGKQDQMIPWDGRTQIYQALQAAVVKFQWYEFDNGHAFIRDDDTYAQTAHSDRNRYDPVAARICFDITLSLFKHKLD